MTTGGSVDRPKKGARLSTGLRVMQILYFICIIIGIIGYIDTRDPKILVILLAMFLPGLVLWLNIPRKFRAMEDKEFADRERDLKGK